MSFLQRVWNGPFKTPPLQQPITVGWVLLKLFESAWRLFLIVLLLIATVLAYVWFDEIHPLSSQVRVSLSPAYGCPKGYPMEVSLENRSGKTLGEVGLKWRVYPRGQSVDVVAYDAVMPDLHAILRPGQVVDYCYRMPALQPGSAGPYTVAADVEYAFELPSNVPVTTSPGTYDAPPSKLSRISEGVVSLVVVMIALGLMASGGYGLMVLSDRLFGSRFQSREAGGVVVVFAFANALVVALASFGLTALHWDGWVNAVDAWSRSAGFEDGASVLMFAIFCQWTWALLPALPQTHAKPVERTENIG